MAEEWISRLVCDAPGDSREGNKYTVSDGSKTVDVVLCSSHEKTATIIDCLAWGTTPRRPAATVPSRGLGRDRLVSLIETTASSG